MAPTVFIDGQEGTTGLQIFDRLAPRRDLRLLEIDPGRRKDPAERRRLLNEADIAILCLPDEAARESVSLITNGTTRVIDASTAHRTHPAWAYGMPELSAVHRRAIAAASRVAVPGCHATGFITIMHPLVRHGIVPPEYPAICFSLTGYSGGGKKLIAAYEDPSRRVALQAPRPYALSLWHKHLPEMQAVAGFKHPPVFQPVVGPFYQGMIVTVPLLPGLLARPASREQIHAILGEAYEGSQFIRVLGLDVEPYLDGGFLDPTACNGTNNLEVLVFGSQERILAAARFDNLGKGASGACVQCLNLMLGVDEATGL